jgi:serralysin
MLAVLREDSMASATSVPMTAVEDIDGVLSGVRWSTTSLTFSFAPTLDLSLGGIVGSGVDTFSATQKDAIRKILKSIESFSGLRFTEVAESGGTKGTLRYGESVTEVTATGYYPSSNAQGGDAWFNTLDYNSPKKGTYAFLTMMHEIGHTIGLDHGHDGRAALPANHDSLEYSVMTYRSYEGSSTGAYTVREGSYPRSFMLSDLAAIQYMYGANYATNAGATVYKWSPTTGELTINGTKQGVSTTNTILETIWDGGGADTYDFSSYATALRIDINPGGWSVTGSAQLAVLGSGHLARGNIASAYLYNGNTASLIENVIGGTGSDRIVGNRAANALSGGAGNDTLYGAAGNDRLAGNAGADRFVFTTSLGSSNIDTITDFAHDSDLLQLDDAIFKAIGTSLTAGEVYAKSGAVKAHDSDDRVIYDTATGRLYYDADGNKAGGVAAINFAILSSKPLLDAGDFAIV